MSVQEYTQRAKAIRDRLRRPPNAVLDTGINLRPLRFQSAPAPILVAPKAPPPPIDANVYISEIPAQERTIRVHDIVRATAQFFGVMPEEIRGPSRRAGIVEARHIAVYLAFRLAYPRRSSPQIAREVGRVDHTTVLHARDKILKRIQFDTALLDKIRMIEGDILEADRR